MDKKFNSEKFGMMICPLCDGYGRIRFPDDVKVCQNCGGFGLTRKEDTFAQRGKPMRQTNLSNSFGRAVDVKE